MANRNIRNDLDEIERIVRGLPQPVSVHEIGQALTVSVPVRTLQHRLGRLVSAGRLARIGAARRARYVWPPALPAGTALTAREPAAEEEFVVPLSAKGAAVRERARRPLAARKPVGYRSAFLERYRPNLTFYLSAGERARLAALGKLSIAAQPAGTYARQILNRLLIDLAWNSSRLEGNTYSLLETRRLIEFGEQAKGRARVEAQMILNHKDAIEFLVDEAGDIGFDRHTILNLHALLANNLLADPAAAGRLRYVAVGIEGSVFHPLEVPQLIDERFARLLATAAAINDPFEQAFFAMVHLPYLQPFDDANKRVSRLAANIPLIRRNLSPLSFAEVPRELYAEAMLGVYESNAIELLKDVFLWAYERSAARYAAVRQSLGEPDPFRLRYRSELRELIAELIRSRTLRSEATKRIAAWTRVAIEPRDRRQFNEAAQAELTSLHEGNFARYRVRPSEFRAWWEAWNAGPKKEPCSGHPAAGPELHGP